MNKKPLAALESLVRHAMGALLLCCAAMFFEGVALAIEPIDPETFDYDRPIVSFEEFKDFFVDSDTKQMMTNSVTGKALSDADLRGYWNEIVSSDPTMRAYMEGRYDLLPGTLKKLPDALISDIQATLHSVTVLREVPGWTQEALGRDGRRLLRVLQNIGPSRLGDVVAQINQMDTTEIQLILRSVDADPQKLLRFIAQPRSMQHSLSMLPEGAELLKAFGGTQGLVNILAKLKLPLPEHSQNQPLKHTLGGLWSVALPSLQLLIADIDPVTTEDGGDLVDPADRDFPQPDHSYKGGGEDADIDPDPVEVTEIAEVPEEDMPATPDDLPAACPEKSVNELEQQNVCGQADVKGFKSFADGLKQANKSLEDIGDVSQLQSDLALMQRAGQAFGKAGNG